VEYYDGFFFNKTRKVMSYRKVTEAEVDHGVLQQGFNLGTLKLITNATEGATGRASGIQLVDIADADAVYQQIKPLVMASA
jgi:membrane protein YdbS with pleckstrin-like domain